MMLSSEHFRVLGQKLNGVAEEVCGGKIVYAHEVRREGGREGGREDGTSVRHLRSIFRYVELDVHTVIPSH